MEETDDIRKLISELNARMREMGAELREVREDVARMRHVLIDGNGTPAMTVRVALVEQELGRVREERADRKLPRSVWTGILVSAVIGIVGIALQVLG